MVSLSLSLSIDFSNFALLHVSFTSALRKEKLFFFKIFFSVSKTVIFNDSYPSSMHDLKTKFELEGKQIEGERMLVAEVDFCEIFFILLEKGEHAVCHTRA